MFVFVWSAYFFICMPLKLIVFVIIFLYEFHYKKYPQIIFQTPLIHTTRHKAVCNLNKCQTLSNIDMGKQGKMWKRRYFYNFNPFYMAGHFLPRKTRTFFFFATRTFVLSNLPQSRQSYLLSLLFFHISLKIPDEQILLTHAF